MAAHPIDPKADDLVALARAKFERLSAAETKLLENAPKGDFAVCGPNDKWDDPANDPSKSGEWDADREIRADLIRWLCVNRTARERVDPKGIQVFGARVVGKLDLAFVSAPFGLILRRCRLAEEAKLYSAELAQLTLAGSWTGAVNADDIKVKGSAYLSDGFRAEGEVRFLGAQIGGVFVCEKGLFTNPSKVALYADRINVQGSVFLRNGFRAEGEVRFLGAQIGSNFECDNSIFTNPSKIALYADRINVQGSVFLRNGFRAEGEMRFLGAQIGSNFECNNSVFTNPSKVALNADRINVQGYVFLRNGFRAEGEVLLLNARIGSNLECDNGVFTNPSKSALTLENINVKGNIFLRSGFRAEGDVRLPGAQIEGEFEYINSTIEGAFEARNMAVARAFQWWGTVNPERASVDLRNASVGTLQDALTGWPPVSKMQLDGFTYARISDAPKDYKNRLEWLARQESFVQQPYRQLAKVLKEEGDNAGARRVLFEMEGLRRKKEDRGRLARFWTRVLQLIIGFGYYPGRSLLWLLGLTVLSLLLTAGGYAAGSIAPTDKDAYGPFKHDSTLPPHYERFIAPVYALENSFPLVKLGQADRWQADPNPGWQCSPSTHFPRPLCRFVSPTVLRVFRWMQICLGWFFTTMFVAGVTGIVRKD